MDDVYKIPIRDVILNNSFNGIAQLSDLLDSNGYYGRHQIRQSVAKGKSNNNYVIQVYLPNSSITYSWPFKSTFDMNEKRINKSRLFKWEHHSPTMCTMMLHILDTGQVFEEYGWHTIWPIVKKYHMNSYIHTIDVIKTLKLYEIIKDGKLILKEGIDIKEMYENLLEKHNKILIK
jgi:hypothetical protein